MNSGRGAVRAVCCQAVQGPEHEDFQRIRSPFEGSLTRLRAIEEEDLPRLHELFWDPDVTRYLTAVWPRPLTGTREWWEGRRSSKEPTFAIETLPGELIGGCDLGPVYTRERAAGLGVWIGRPYWDRGCGTDAVRTLCRFAFGEMNLQRVWLSVLETNPRARRAYESVGFKEEGRRRRAFFDGGRYVDSIEMGLLAEDLIEP